MSLKQVHFKVQNEGISKLGDFRKMILDTVRLYFMKTENKRLIRFITLHLFNIRDGEDEKDAASEDEDGIDAQSEEGKEK